MRGQRHGTCGKPALEVIANVPLCRGHRDGIRAHLGGATYAVSSGVVYYLGDPEVRQIKIGCSMRLGTRITSLLEQRPAIVLLAVEPGYKDLERARHREFRQYRVAHHGGNREWYHKNDELMAWINSVRQYHGEPWEHPAVKAVPR